MKSKYIIIILILTIIVTYPYSLKSKILRLRVNNIIAIKNIKKCELQFVEVCNSLILGYNEDIDEIIYKFSDNKNIHIQSIETVERKIEYLFLPMNTFHYLGETCTRLEYCNYE
jgi:hypothetical protein